MDRLVKMPSSSGTIPVCGPRILIDNVVLGLFIMVILSLVKHFMTYLVYALAAIRYPFELDYGEGIVWQQALLIPSARMYGDITRFPFIVFHYPPFYHLMIRGAATLGFDVLPAGRTISVMSTLAIGALASAIAFSAIKEREGSLPSLVGAVISGLSVFCFWPVVVWSPLLRVDMLAIALSFLGVWLAARSPACTWQLYLATILFVLAAYTKQTCIAAPLATLPVMLLCDHRRTLRASYLGLLVGVTALLVLTVMTDSGFLRHVLLYNFNRYSLIAAVLTVLGQWRQTGFLLLAISAIVIWWRRLAIERASAGTETFWYNIRHSINTRLMAILTLYFIISTCMLATLGKSGGAPNYMIEWMCVWSVLIGTLVASSVGRALARHRQASERVGVLRLTFALLLPVVLLAQVIILPAASEFADSGSSQIQQLNQLLARVKQAKQPVLSDDMVLLLKAGKEVPWEPAIFAELASTGEWDERRIIDMIEAHAFAFVITKGRRGEPLYDSRHTRAVTEAILTAYPRMEEYAGRSVHLPPG